MTIRVNDYTKKTVNLILLFNVPSREDRIDFSLAFLSIYTYSEQTTQTMGGKQKNDNLMFFLHMADEKHSKINLDVYSVFFNTLYYLTIYFERIGPILRDLTTCDCM